MAFRGFTEEDLSKINSVKLESDSGSDYDDVEEEEERDENTTEKGASASFSGHHRKQKTLGSMNVKSLLFSQRIHIPMEAMLSVSNTETSKPLDVDAKPPVRSSTFAPSPSETNNDVSSDYASHSPSEASSCAGSPNKKTPAVASTVNGEPNSPSLDDSSSDADFSQLKLVLNSHPTPSPPHPSSIGVKLDLATVKSLPLDWDNTSSLNALIEFEQNRKKLEDLNDRKKKELKKALEEKAKKTEEDMKKISEISQELKKLDSNLSNDVSILRKQIEVASYDFNEAQKRFEKAEKEYLVAKLELFTKREKKELLTGHLCSIIEQNEFRKAKKLSDLMGQLEIGSKELTQQACPSPKEDTADTNSDHKDVSTPT